MWPNCSSRPALILNEYRWDLIQKLFEDPQDAGWGMKLGLISIAVSVSSVYYKCVVSSQPPKAISFAFVKRCETTQPYP